MIVDNCCMQLVSDPHQFDVMLMPNLYGAIVSNVICGLMGGAGLISGRNYGIDVSCIDIILDVIWMLSKCLNFEQYAIFEPGTRGTGTNLAGRDIANPISMMNAAADLLQHLELPHHCARLRAAIHQTISVDKIHTPGKIRLKYPDYPPTYPEPYPYPYLQISEVKPKVGTSFETS